MMITKGTAWTLCATYANGFAAAYAPNIGLASMFGFMCAGFAIATAVSAFGDAGREITRLRAHVESLYIDIRHAEAQLQNAQAQREKAEAQREKWRAACLVAEESATVSAQELQMYVQGLQRAAEAAKPAQDQESQS